MKLPKWVVDRRVALMRESGIEFACGVDAAEKVDEIIAESAAVVLACGAREPRCVDVSGSSLDGIHFAVDYLTEATRALLEGREAYITAAGKDVAVIGGGDTGVDCVATALRQGARSVRQIVRAAKPSEQIDVQTAWPGPRNVYVQAYGQREAAELLGADPRLWSTDTVGFSDDGSGGVSAVCVRPIPTAQSVPSGEVGKAGETIAPGEDCSAELPAQLVLIAKGFTGPERSVLDAFGIDDAARVAGVKAEESKAPVYLAGDARLGSTLVATAMADALQVAARIAESLQDN